MARTEEFELLYRRVTGVLQDFVRRKTNWSSDEEKWFVDLISGFLNEFEIWDTPTTPPSIRQYLQLFDRESAQVRLASHAFLHIAYDLPRVIAQTLRPPSTEARLGQIFLEPSPLFLKAFVDFAKEGGFGLMGRLLGWKPSRIVGFWTLALRSQAWIHAMVLAELLAKARSSSRPPSEYDALVRKMEDGLLRAGTSARKAGLFGISEFNNADLAPAIWPLTMIQDSTANQIAGTLGVVGLGIGLELWRRRRRAISRIEVLGTLVHVEMERALQSRDRGDSGPRSVVLTGASR